MQAYVITAVLHGQECTNIFLENTTFRVLGMKSSTSDCKKQCYSRTNFPLLAHVNFLKEKRLKDPSTMHCICQQTAW